MELEGYSDTVVFKSLPCAKNDSLNPQSNSSVSKIVPLDLSTSLLHLFPSSDYLVAHWLESSVRAVSRY